MALALLFFCRGKKTSSTTKVLHTKGWFRKRLPVNSREIMTFGPLHFNRELRPVLFGFGNIALTFYLH